MQGLAHFLEQSDAIGTSVAVLLLLMSVAAWSVIVWKTVVLRRAMRGLSQGVPAFWDALDLAQARARLSGLDPERLLAPLVEAALLQEAAGTLAAQAQGPSQITRRLRDALQSALERLQFGQVLLASVGSTAPFVGLFGTVWGIYHALVAIGGSGAFSIDKVAGPVGEALVMTAAGLAVAIPAVLGYNLFGKWIAQCEAVLEGFAHDLQALGTPSEGRGSAEPRAGAHEANGANGPGAG